MIARAGEQVGIYRTAMASEADAYQSGARTVHMGVADGGVGREGVPAVMRGRPCGRCTTDTLADARAECLVALARAALKAVKIGEAVEVAVASEGEQVAGSGVIDACAQQQFEVGVFFEEFGDG